MSRSSRRSIKVPNPIRDGLQHQLDSGLLGYPSENAAWVGLARYQLIVGKPHPITEAIAKMHSDDQDLIDDYLCHVAQNNHSLKGQLLHALIQKAIEKLDEPTEQDIQPLLPEQLLRMAREWREGD